MARWKYYGDPTIRTGDVIITSTTYGPSWLWRRYCELRIHWLRLFR